MKMFGSTWARRARLHDEAGRPVHDAPVRKSVSMHDEDAASRPGRPSFPGVACRCQAA